MVLTLLRETFMHVMFSLPNCVVVLGATWALPAETAIPNFPLAVCLSSLTKCGRISGLFLEKRRVPIPQLVKLLTIV